VPTVVFDVRANHDTGVSRYGLSLLAATAPLAAAVGWRLIVVSSQSQATRARSAVAPWSIPVLIPPDDTGFVRRSAWLRSFMISNAVDLYYTTHYTVDRRCPVPFAFTIHDLTRLRHPELSYTDDSFATRFGRAELSVLKDETQALRAEDATYSTGAAFTEYFYALNRHLVQRAQRIITVSNATAADIDTLLKVEANAVDVVPCSVDTATFHPRDSAQITALRMHLGLRGPYLLYVGLTHPNKRLGWLMDHLLNARSALPANSKLVIVGGHAERDPNISRLLATSDAREFVTFIGRVSDEDLATLYSGASALVTASISEGYCLPPVEAVVCGSRAIVTDLPVLRETLGTAASFFPPDAPDEFVRLARDSLRGSLPRTGSLPIAPDWSRSGLALFDSLNLALASAPATTGSAGTWANRKHQDQARRMRA
jgi:glycosyltransferase involved in cell wall biosynthesis